MSNLFNNLKPTAHLHKNGFDLSQRHIFGCNVGELIPSMVVDCVPSDHFSIHLNSLCRTLPLNTAAFARVKWFHHFFFVPYSVLWSQWDSFITQRDNNYSAQANGRLYVPYFKGRDIQTNADPIGEMASLFDNITDNQGMFKLLDYLGYGAYYGSGIPDDINFNAFRLLAYNKIWYDYYRNTYYDERERISNLDYIGTWNVDDVVCRDVTDAHIFNTAGLYRGNTAYNGFMFGLKFRQWKKDILTSLLPNSQYGAVSFVNIGDDQNEPFYLKARSASTNRTSLQINGYSTASGEYTDVVRGATDTPATFNAINLGFDVLTLRKAEYLQKWKETTMRAGQQALAQYEAHFGVKPRHTLDHMAKFLGGVSQNVMVDEVLQTSNDIADATSTQNGVGDIYGKGISVSDDGKISFDCTEFGVLMCISSFVPEADYEAQGCDRNNQLFEPFDFFTPEFQNLGMEPVTLQEFKVQGYDNQERNTILGYAPRYWNYKTAKDKVHGAFIRKYNQVQKSWVTARVDYGNFEQGLTRSSLYVNPHVMDNITAVSYSHDFNAMQFLCNIHFDCKAVRPMSVLGLPVF